MSSSSAAQMPVAAVHEQEQSQQMSELSAQIDAIKAKVIELKKANPDWKTAPNADVDAAIATLKDLLKQEKAAKKAAESASKKAASSAKKGAKKDDSKVLLAMQHSKADEFNEWYNEVIYKAELISAYPISGCYM